MAVENRGPYQWRARIRRRGLPPQSKTFETKSEADAWERMILSEMDRGVFRSRAEAESTTVKECMKRYLLEVTPHKKGAYQEEMKSRHILRHNIASLFMANVRGQDVAEYRDDRLALGKAPSTVKKEMALLSHMFNVARQEWGMESISNPVQLVRKPKVENARDRRLFSGEEELLLEACSPRFTNSNVWLKPLVELALETAMRKGELLDLLWNNVDIDKRRLKCKNKDPKGKVLTRHVPLSSRSVEILSGLPRSIDGRVFPTNANAIKLAFPRACKRACEHVYDLQQGKKKACKCKGIEGLRFHDLRHEATSRMVESGLFSDTRVAEITGHRSLQMLKRYTHLRNDDLASLLDQATERRTKN